MLKEKSERCGIRSTDSALVNTSGVIDKKAELMLKCKTRAIWPFLPPNGVSDLETEKKEEKEIYEQFWRFSLVVYFSFINFACTALKEFDSYWSWIEKRGNRSGWDFLTDTKCCGTVAIVKILQPALCSQMMNTMPSQFFRDSCHNQCGLVVARLNHF